MFKKIAMIAVLVSLLAMLAITAFAQNDTITDTRPHDGSCMMDMTATDTDNFWSQTEPTDMMMGRGGQVGRGRGNGGGRGGGNGANGSEMGLMLDMLPPATEGELPQEIIDLVIEGWLDEQHAYAVYENVIEQFDSPMIFVNIQRAETQHASAWEMILDRYGIEIPEIPEFDAITFETLTDACDLGVQAEIANFDLYDEMLDAFSDYPDILQVATALRDASEFNHLPAFESCAAQ